MNILFLTPPPSLPNRLHRIRAYELITILSKRHNVHLLSITTQAKTSKDFTEIKKKCKSTKIIHVGKLNSVINCFLYPTLPYEVAYCLNTRVKEEIKKIIMKKKIDLIYYKRLRSGVYFDDYGIPAVLDTTDAMSMFYMRMKKYHSFPKKSFYSWESYKYKNYEKVMMKKIPNWIVCSDADQKYLQRINVNTNIFIIPNAVNLDSFDKKGIKKEKNALLFRGLMDKPVNIDAVIFFINHIFPLIQEEVPDVVLKIVGPNPHKTITKYANKHIVVTGYVDNLPKALIESYISICPIRIGTGTRNKILQSWAAGTPVVSTTVGAEGLKTKDKENIMIANSPIVFAKKTIELLTNKELYNKIRLYGYKTAQQYSFSAIEKNLNNSLSYVSKRK